MTPVLLVLLGVLAVAAGALVLRRIGPGFRIGRILAATPRVSVAEATAIAESGEARYVGVQGRVDAETEFFDVHQRPLVLRRTRLQVRSGAGWRTFDDRRETVPFELRQELSAIAIDAEALADGLVVLPRESIGVAADLADRAELADRAPAGVEPSTPVRLLVEQVSSVDHAVALGRPRLGPDGRPRLEPGLGRPLVLTTLEPVEAIRLLGGGRRATSLAGAGLLAVGVVGVVVGLGWALAAAVA